MFNLVKFFWHSVSMAAGRVLYRTRKKNLTVFLNGPTSSHDKT